MAWVSFLTVGADFVVALEKSFRLTRYDMLDQMCDWNLRRRTSQLTASYSVDNLEGMHQSTWEAARRVFLEGRRTLHFVRLVTEAV